MKPRPSSLARQLGFAAACLLASMAGCDSAPRGHEIQTAAPPPVQDAARTPAADAARNAEVHRVDAGAVASDAAVVAVGSDAGNASDPACAAAVSGIAVDMRELAGYPPYAIDGCTLVYVAPTRAGDAGGALMLRQLESGLEEQLAGPSEAARRPAIAGEIIAWEATLDAHSVVRVRAHGQVRTLSGAFDHAAEPRATSDAVVFSAWQSADDLGDSDVWLYLPANGELTAIVTGPGQQRFADVSPTHVAVSDFSEDPDGRYDGAGDLADIVLYDRGTRTTTLRKLSGKQAFPMLGSAGVVGYLHWELADVHPEPKLAGYRLRVGALTGTSANDQELANVISGEPPYVRPALRAGVAEWVATANGQYSLWRAAVDRSSPPSAVKQSALPMYAPAPARDFTVLATRAASANVALESVRR